MKRVLFAGVAALAATSAMAWLKDERTSRVDDSPIVQLSVLAKATTQNQYGEARRMTLTLLCEENTTLAAIWFGGHFMSDLDHGEITYRVDDRPAQRRKFIASNNNEYLGLRSNAAISFIKDLFGGESLYVRALPFSESAVEADFNISGLETAITPLRATCHW